MSTFSVSIKDPTLSHTSYHDELRASIEAAGAHWDRYISGAGSIEIEVAFDPNLPTAASAATNAVAASESGGVTTYHQGVAAEMLTGADPNGSAPGAVMIIGSGFLDDLWFDPSPLDRTGPVDPAKYDAVSVFMHEIGHMIAFNGWRDPDTGALSGAFQSTYDTQIETVAGGTAFAGPEAVAVYGGPVPVTHQSAGHLGNPGDAAANDLMTGVGIYPGTRYDVSALDLAVLEDCGIDTVNGASQIAQRAIAERDVAADLEFLGGTAQAATAGLAWAEESGGSTETDAGVCGSFWTVAGLNQDWHGFL